MKRYVVISLVVFLIMVINSNAIYAQRVVKNNTNSNDTIGETLASIEKKLKDFEDKLDEIEKNQEKILKEINICTIRARR